MRILGIAGSLRTGSVNEQLLRLAGETLPDGVEFAVWEGLRDIPPFDQDTEETPSVAVAGLRSAVVAADAVLIATPEYNGSIPGTLKNALDWGSRPGATSAFRGKPVAVIGASPGAFGGVCGRTRKPGRCSGSWARVSWTPGSPSVRRPIASRHRTRSCSGRYARSSRPSWPRPPFVQLPRSAANQTFQR